jgi:hypothetical protein
VHEDALGRVSNVYESDAEAFVLIGWVVASNDEGLLALFGTQHRYDAIDVQTISEHLDIITMEYQVMDPSLSLT